MPLDLITRPTSPSAGLVLEKQANPHLIKKPRALVCFEQKRATGGLRMLLAIATETEQKSCREKQQLLLLLRQEIDFPFEGKSKSNLSFLSRRGLVFPFIKRRVEARPNTHKFPNFFGAVTAISRAHFELLNGFSNQFWGWGGEDDDMEERIKHAKLNVTKCSKDIDR